MREKTVNSVVVCASYLSFYVGKLSNFSFLFHHCFVLFSRFYAVKIQSQLLSVVPIC
jgi:hypothetical protein